MDAQLAALWQVLSDGRKANYGNVSSLALMVFDYILTMREEVDLVWRSQWTRGKIIFLIYRYAGLAAQIFNTYVWVNTSANLPLWVATVCSSAIKFQTASSAIVLCFAEFTLAIRVWILYNRSWWIFSLLFFLIFAGAIIVGVLDGLAFGGPITGSLLPEPLGSGCDTIGLPVPNFLFLAIVPTTVSTSVLFLLTLLKTVHAVRFDRKNTPTLSLILKDGVVYFAATFGILVANALIFRLARLTMKGAASGFVPAIPYMMACRLMLNIRGLIVNPTAFQTDSYVEGDLSLHYELSRRNAKLPLVFTNKSRCTCQDPTAPCPKHDIADNQIAEGSGLRAATYITYDSQETEHPSSTVKMDF